MLSVCEIEEQIADYRLNFPQTRVEEVEWGLNFPMFVESLNLVVRERKNLPSQDEFVHEYFSRNSEKLASMKLDDRLRKGLEARLRRTYPSLVRDVHFSALLKEAGFETEYNEDVDIAKGVDQTIKYKGVEFQIHCFVKTTAGISARRMKNRRHEFSGIHIDLPLDMSDSETHKVGDFYLYSTRHMDVLRAEMEIRIVKAGR